MGTHLSETAAPKPTSYQLSLPSLLESSPHIHIHDEAVLAQVLEQLDHRHIHVTISTPNISSASITAISSFLANKNESVTELTLSGLPLGDAGATRILASLAKPRDTVSPLRRLALHNVGVRAVGMVCLAEILSDGDFGDLRDLDLSNNNGNWPGVRAVAAAIASRAHLHRPPIAVDDEGNLVVVELLNAATHGVGACAALAGGAVMTVRALQHGLSLARMASLLVFVASLFTLMTSSCVYHSCFRHPRASRRLRKADHCSIFVLIAGTYTPFVVCYALEPPTVCGPVTLVVVWVCAAAGIAMSLMSAGSNRTRALFALATGWVGAFSVQTMLERMQGGALSLVVTGGVTYSVGIIFYLLGNRIPVMHVVWHIAVMFGGGFHFFALWQYVVNA